MCFFNLLSFCWYHVEVKVYGPHPQNEILVLFTVVPVKDRWQDPAPPLLHGSPARDFCFCCHFQTSTSVLFSISPTKQISSHFPSVLCTHLDFNLTPSYILSNLKPVLDQSLFIEFEMLPRELSPEVRYMYSLMMSSTGILHHVHCFMF